MDKIITGRCASKGTVFGKVKKVKSLTANLEVITNRIIIVEYLTTELLNYLNLIKGVISEVGSITSHPAIVCREKRVPYLIVTSNSLSTLRNDDYILLNANEGIIKVLKSRNNK